MGVPKLNEENFITIRCVGCHKVLLEASEGTEGVLKKHCPKCKVMRKIRLPFLQKTDKLREIKAMA